MATKGRVPRRSGGDSREKTGHQHQPSALKPDGMSFGAEPESVTGNSHGSAWHGKAWKCKAAESKAAMEWIHCRWVFHQRRASHRRATHRNAVHSTAEQGTAKESNASSLLWGFGEGFSPRRAAWHSSALKCSATHCKAVESKAV